MNRKLSLRKETLAELSAGELESVVGAASDNCVTFTILVTGCQCTAIVPSLNVNCPTARPCRD